MLLVLRIGGIHFIIIIFLRCEIGMQDCCCGQEIRVSGSLLTSNLISNTRKAIWPGSIS